MQESKQASNHKQAIDSAKDRSNEDRVSELSIEQQTCMECKLASKQAGKQESKQTNNLASWRTSKQLYRQAIKQASKQSSTQENKNN